MAPSYKVSRCSRRELVSSGWYGRTSQLYFFGLAAAGMAGRGLVTAFPSVAKTWWYRSTRSWYCGGIGSSPLDRKSPTQFTSTEPPGSPYWYPPTPIHYAILYHSDGYFVHDAWWRVNFGPGSQFPHYDTGGDESFAGNGSHGCINMPENDAAWVYANTDWNTQIMVY